MQAFIEVKDETLHALSPITCGHEDFKPGCGRHYCAGCYLKCPSCGCEYQSVCKIVAGSYIAVGNVSHLKEEDMSKKKENKKTWTAVTPLHISCPSCQRSYAAVAVFDEGGEFVGLAHLMTQLVKEDKRD
ncbi:hypothetical protein LCGC14_1696660 [marine sediment metagenome]|uniref:Uncharacterized protein n=1 Tax=marine sediment metagenome TaxID=412755 RepID=A0A0F9KJ77_9ZZZZ